MARSSAELGLDRPADASATRSPEAPTGLRADEIAALRALTSTATLEAVANQAGLSVPAALAALSTLEIGGARSLAVLRHERLPRAGLLAVLAGWALWSLTSAPPLDRPLPPKDATGPIPRT